MVQTLRKQFLAPVCFRMKLGQVQAWVHNPSSNFDSARIRNTTSKSYRWVIPVNNYIVPFGKSESISRNCDFKCIVHWTRWMSIRGDHYVTKMYINLRKAKFEGVNWGPQTQFLVRRPCRFRHFCRRSLEPGQYMGYVSRSAGTYRGVGPKFGYGALNVPIFTKLLSNLQ